jgi:hypothetical protein
VRFPDGEIRRTTYSGTADVLTPGLSGDAGWDEAPEGEIFDVEIFTTYGYGFWWRGRAARNVVVDGVEPYGSESFTGQMYEPPSEMHHGEPDWLPEEFRRALDGRP